jgi:hypothetical protein
MSSRTLLAAVLSVSAVLGSSSGLLAQQPTAVSQSALDAFAASPEARTSWSHFIGDILSPSAYLRITAVELQTPGRKMRGVRFEPQHQGDRPDCESPYIEWRLLCEHEGPSVYIEESALPRFIEQTRQGAAGLAGYTAVSRTRSGRPGNMREGYIILGYEFSGDAGAELVDILTAAQQALQQRP